MLLATYRSTRCLTLVKLLVRPGPVRIGVAIAVEIPPIMLSQVIYFTSFDIQLAVRVFIHVTRAAVAKIAPPLD